MIKDTLREYSDGQAITATAVSTKELDNGSVTNNMNQPLIVRAKVDGTGAGTIQPVLQHKDVGGAFADVMAGAAVVGSTIKAGDDLFNGHYPKGVKQITRINYVVSSAVTVTVDAFDGVA